MSGKWDDWRFPKKGWQCVEVLDNEDCSDVCEMCEVQAIRYVHVMEHVVVGLLNVGCVCAGHLEGDMEAARDRESLFIKRERFARRKGWTATAKGERLNVDGFRVVVFRQGEGWKVVISEPGDWGEFGKKVYRDAAEAKRGAFDAYVYALGKRARLTEMRRRSPVT